MLEKVTMHGKIVCTKGSEHMKQNKQFVEEMSIENPTLLPLESYKGAHEKISFKCLVCGSIIKKAPTTALSGKKCSVCAGNIKKTQEEYESALRSVHPNLSVIGEYHGYGEKIKCKCSICGYIWETRAGRLIKKGIGCPECNKYIHTSFPEQAIYYYLQQVFPDTVNSYNEGFGKSEIDCYIPSLKVGIEYDGAKWHSDKLSVERKKYKKCQVRGIQLIRIREIMYSDDCDYCILIDSKNRNYCELDNAIKQLYSILMVPNILVVDTARDRYEIQKLYLKEQRKNSLAANYPNVAREWCQEMNGGITPDMVSAKSNESYHWRCPTCHHIYKTAVHHRTHEGTGCPNCAGNTTKEHSVFLEEMKSVNPTIRICSKYHRAFEKVDCECTICNHKWRAVPDSLLRGEGCPKCANNIRKTQEEFVLEVKKTIPSLVVLGKYINSKTPILCRCGICEYEWKPIPLGLLRGHGCPNCAGNRKKKVKCIETGIVYESAAAAEKSIGISKAAIRKCCLGNSKTSGGYHWQYME